MTFSYPRFRSTTVLLLAKDLRKSKVNCILLRLQPRKEGITRKFWIRIRTPILPLLLLPLHRLLLIPYVPGIRETRSDLVLLRLHQTIKLTRSSRPP